MNDTDPRSDDTLAEALTTILRDHVSHGGAGAGSWNADCLGCSWTAHGQGGLTEVWVAHRAHVAAVICSAAASAAEFIPWQATFTRGEVQQVILDLAAHPAMQARDAALVQQGRDEADAVRDREFGNLRWLDGHEQGLKDGVQQGRDEVAAAVEAVREGHFGYDGRVFLDRKFIRAAVAAAGASDLATIRAEAIRDAADNIDTTDGTVTRLWLQNYADRVATEAGERQ